MSNLALRTITGTMIVAVIALCVWHPLSLLVLCAGIATAGLLEFYRLFEVTSHRLQVGVALALSFSLFFTHFCRVVLDASPHVFLLNLPFVSFLFLTVLVVRSGSPFMSLALVVLGIAYIVLPLVLVFLAAFAPDGQFRPNVILGYFMLLWSNDTGAYVAGSLWGRLRLAPVISPKKTWEGSIGGVALAVACAYVNSIIFHGTDPVDWIWLALLVALTGTLGDLVKSVMKRSLGIKDSGHVLPGHGGILDRFDSLIGSVPFVYMFLHLSEPQL